MESKTQERSPIVNILKGIGIIFVVFGHIASPLTNFIFSWHMPLFFFISGFYIDTENSLWHTIKKEFKKLILIFIFFTVLGILATYFRNILLGRDNQEILRTFFDAFLWMDMKHMNNYGFVLWFLPALFWARILVLIQIKLAKHKIIILSSTVLLFIISKLIITPLPFVFDIGITVSIWVMLGYILFNWLQKHIKYSHVSLIIFVLLITMLPYGSMDLSNRYLPVPLYSLFYSLIVILALFIASQKLNPENSVVKKLSFLGKNSMFIFLFHPYTNNVVYLFVNRYLSNIWYIKYVLSIFLIYIILKLYRKYFTKKIFNYV